MDRKIEKFMQFKDAYLEENRIWFVSETLPILCCANIETGELMEYQFIPYETPDKMWLFSKVYRYQSELIFVPLNADYILVYNLDSKVMDKIELPERLIGSKDKFYASAYANNQIFMFPWNISTIVRYNCATRKIDMYELELKQNEIETPKIISAKILHNKIYAPMCDSNIICILNIENCEISFMQIGESGIINGFEIYKEELMVIMKNQEDITVYNESGNLLRKLTTPIENLNGDTYIETLVWGEAVFILDVIYNRIAILDMKNYEIETVYDMKKSDEVYISCPYIKGNDIFFFPRAGNKVLSNDGDRIVETEITFDGSEIFKDILKKSNQCISEGFLCSLEDFIHTIG